MAAKFPGSRWVVHVFYWLLLIGGYYYFQGQIDRQMQVHRALGSCLQAACAAVNQQNEKLLMDITTATDAYRTEAGKTIHSASQQALRAVLRFQDELTTLATTPTDGPESRTDPDLPGLTLLQDTLIIRYQPVPELNAEIKQLLTENQHRLPFGTLAGLLRNADPVDRNQMIGSLQLRAALAGKKALNYYYSQTRYDIEGHLSGLAPTMTPQKWCLKTGELFEADIFLTAYSPGLKYSKATVNGESFPVQDGKMHFSRRFETPGAHPLDVTLAFTNPLTGEVKTYIRTFEVYIQSQE